VRSTYKDEALLVGRDAFLVLDLGLYIVDGVGRFDLEGDGLACVGELSQRECGAGWASESATYL
jgi:hypothetical protein